MGKAADIKSHFNMVLVGKQPTPTYLNTFGHRTLMESQLDPTDGEKKPTILSWLKAF
jgi:hypothetical protein